MSATVAEHNPQKLTTVVKIVNNTQTSANMNGKDSVRSNSTHSPQTKKLYPQLDTNIGAMLPPPVPSSVAVARIHSNGSQYPNQAPPAHAYNLNPVMSSSTNYSMTSSIVSNASIPNGTLSTTNNDTTVTVAQKVFKNQNGNESTFNGSNQTILSGSSIAIIDISNSSNASNRNIVNTNAESTTGSNPINRADKASSDSVDHSGTSSQRNLHRNNSSSNFYISTSQPESAVAANNNRSLINGSGVSDGVRYKFKSNETIGVKNSHGEFDDINTKSSSGKLGRCGKCCKRCTLM